MTIPGTSLRGSFVPRRSRPFRGASLGSFRSLRLPATLLSVGASLLTFLIADSPPKIVAGVAFGILAMIAATRWPGLTLAAVPVIATALDGRLQPPVRLGSLVVVLVALWVVSRRQPLNRPTVLIAGTLMVWIVANFAFVAVPLGTGSTYRELLVVLEGLGLCAVTATVGVSVNTLLRGLTLMGPAVSFFCYFPTETSEGRASALGINPNSLGTLLAVGATAALLDFRRTRSPVAALCGVVALSSMPLVQSRGSVVAAGAGLFAAVLAGRRLLPALRLALLAFIILFSVPVLSSATEKATPDRTTSGTESSNQHRTGAALVSLDAARHNLLTGVGFGRAIQIARSDPRTLRPIVPHNGFLSLASEFGAPALLGFLALILTPSLASFSSKHAGSDLAYLFPIILTFMVAALFLTLFDSAPMVAPLWVTVGASWGLYSRRPFNDAPAQHR